MSRVSRVFDWFYVKLKKNHIIRRILHPAAWLYKKTFSPRKKKLQRMHESVMENGLKAIEEFNIVLSNNGFRYSLAAGTMLGAMREHGFIKHDVDIDTIMWIDEFNPSLYGLLEKAGFKLVHSFSIGDGTLGKEDTFEKYGVQIDLFYICNPLEKNGYPYFCDFNPYPDCGSWEQSVRVHGGVMPRRIDIPAAHDVMLVTFENIQLPVFTNAHECLLFRYGEDYMIPNPQWKDRNNPHVKAWPEQVASYDTYVH